MALESQLVLESDSPTAQMKQLKLTLALNRGIDRSDEIVGGFTLPLCHLPPPPLNHRPVSLTAEFHLYVNEEKGATSTCTTTPSSSPVPSCSTPTVLEHYT